MPSPARLWTGRILTALAVLFWLMDGAIKLPPIEPVITTLQGLGFTATPALARGLGVLQLACLALYLLPRTSVIGAIALSAFLGGAIAVNLRVGNPWFTHTLFGVYVGLVTWAGLLLRKPRACELLFAR
ncbi:DoxX family protein [Luteibacter yeojuensis]|uniref:Membrane protein n=1 Tax=Luteibacter yeojuensis TaxID=345309 RepID=A0A0F3KWR0_9GAMM|nr:DoxX family protein [Luteibacter yeojuensis]KJV35705.1 membrane protein [Luteibacter yeojuensis]